MDIDQFRPHPLIRGGHIQTMYPVLSGKATKLPGDRVHLVSLPDGDKIAILENKPNNEVREPILLVHGLGSSAHDPGVTRLARKLLEQGRAVYRMNHRGISEGRGHARGIYHANRGADICSAVEFICNDLGADKLSLVAYSMSAMMSLKVLGQHGMLNNTPCLDKVVTAICVCPPMDMSESAKSMESRVFGVYNRVLLSSAMQYLDKRRALYPDVRDHREFDVKTFSDLNKIFICREAGEYTAENYYLKSSPASLLPHIKGNVHVISADDDPIAINSRHYLQDAKNLQVHMSRSGGHLGFLAKGKEGLKPVPWLDDFTLHLLESGN